MSGRRATKSIPGARAKRGTRGTSGPAADIGPTGPQGPRGPRGPAGRSHTSEIAALTDQVEVLVRELKTQLIRIAQIQAQLDHLAKEQTVPPRNRRITDDIDD
jgi:hypothetical protein